MPTGSLSRRHLLQGLGCSLAAYPMTTRITLASAPWDNRLVVIVLRGAMDGLDVVRPTGDPDFAALRPGFDAETLPLGGFFGLHEAMSELHPLWEAGELAFAHAVSTPYRDRRSHFEGQDMLEAGTGMDVDPLDIADGWLNRLLQAMPGLDSETGFAVGRDMLRILMGDAPVSSWAPDASLNMGLAAQQLLAGHYSSDPLFHDAASQAIALADVTDDMAMGGGGARGLPERPIAEFAADRLRGDTRIASFSLSGWDTHRGQARAMPNLLRRLSDTVLTLRSGLGPVWDKTTVLAMTEFGRTARENGSGGTDHGTGGAMLIAGGAIRGQRVLGRWPGLAEADLYGRRDLMPTRDVRSYAGWCMRSLFGLPRSTIEDVIFPGLDLGEDPQLIL